MLLLNHTTSEALTGVVSSFTFQYASIKPTGRLLLAFSRERHLHFNMLLLNLIDDNCPTDKLLLFTFQYASIKPALAALC